MACPVFFYKNVQFLSPSNNVFQIADTKIEKTHVLAQCIGIRHGIVSSLEDCNTVCQFFEILNALVRVQKSITCKSSASKRSLETMTK